MTGGILMLCDDLMFTSKVTATGRAHGVSVALARTPAAALAKAIEIQPATILIDLHLSGLNLPEFLASLSPRPRVIGFGSHVDLETLKAARQAGCEQVIPRSRFASSLETSISDWADHGKS